MKRKYKLNKRGKELIIYSLIFILDIIFILNSKDILREVNTINDYRFNSLIYSFLFLVNVIALVKINGEK